MNWGIAVAVNGSPQCKGRDKVSYPKAVTAEDLVLSSVSPHDETLSNKAEIHLSYFHYHV